MPYVIISYHPEEDDSYRDNYWGSFFELFCAETLGEVSKIIAENIAGRPDAYWTHVVVKDFADLLYAAGYHAWGNGKAEQSVFMPFEEGVEDITRQYKPEQAVLRGLVADRLGPLAAAKKEEARLRHERELAERRESEARRDRQRELELLASLKRKYPDQI
jgi:hypothetical protein